MEYAKEEAEDRRGRAQTLLQMVNTAGYFVSVTIVAFGFNGRMFTGSFNQRHQLSYQEAMGIVAAMCTVTGAMCAIKVHERPGGECVTSRILSIVMASIGKQGSQLTHRPLSSSFL